jgi:hypothetical protein
LIFTPYLNSNLKITHFHGTVFFFQSRSIFLNAINRTIFTLALVSFPVAAQSPEPVAPAVKEKAQGCDATTCPRQDQNGQPPTSCSHEYGITTGFRCILLCVYPDSQWGTVLASSDCD